MTKQASKVADDTGWIVIKVVITLDTKPTEENRVERVTGTALRCMHWYARVKFDILATQKMISIYLTSQGLLLVSQSSHKDMHEQSFQYVKVHKNLGAVF